MNRKNIFLRVKEMLYCFIRNKSRSAFKDEIILLKNLETGIICDLNKKIISIMILLLWCRAVNK